MALLVGSGTSLGGLAGGAATARLLVVIGGEATGLQAAVAQAQGSLATFQSGAGRLGTTLTRSLTLPLVALGGASVMLAMDFQAAMARVEGLTPIVDQVQGGIESLTESILKISETVPVAPTELANALYFAGSAGLSAAQALDVVELSAKGASIGMGSAADISKVLIFSLNAFEGQGLTAAEAMDTLTAAIREGTAEPNELAIALGRLLPIAKQAGVAFSEVVGSIAALTNIGVPTRVATTGLRALFSQLLAPTVRATDNLDALGISANELRDAISAGPVVAFNLLLEATEGNQDAIRTIIPQIRGLTAFYGLIGDRADEVQEVFYETAHATGYLDKAFAAISKTTQFKFSIALNDLRRAGIELGTGLFPVFEKLFGFIGDIGELFLAMPGWGQAAVAAFIVMAAAAGPLLKVWSGLTAQGKGMFTTFTSTTTGLIVMAAAAAIAIGGFQTLASGQVSVTSVLTTGIGTYIAATLALRGLNMALASGVLGGSSFANSLYGITGRAGPVALAITALVVSVGTLVGKIGEAEREAKELGDSLLDLGSNALLAKNVLNDLADTGEIGEIFAAHVRRFGLEGKSVSVVLQDLNNRFKDLGSAGLSAGDAISAGLSQGAPELELLSEALAQTERDLKATTMDKLKSFASEEDALVQLQGAWGATEDEASAALGELSLRADELIQSGDGAVDMAGELAGFLDKTTGAASGTADALDEMNQELVESRQEALRGTALGALFDPSQIDKVNASISKLIGNARQTAGVFVSMAGNIRTLFERGLDPTVLQFLADQGPGMVAQFVNASGKELRQLEVAYQTTLGAVDAAVLNEGRHQAGKGQNMVGDFAQAILSSKHLPVNATRSIVNTMTQAFGQGKVDRQALLTVQRFVDGLANARGITKREAGKLAEEFTREVASGNFDRGGHEAVQRFARGVSQRAGLAKGSAKDVALAAEAALAGVEGFSIGSGLISQFAAGIRAGIPVVTAAATQAALAAKKAAMDALSGSPKMFSFYAGQDIMKQLGEGMTSYPRPNMPAPRLPAQGNLGARGTSPTMLRLEVDGKTISRTVEVRRREQRLLMTGRRGG